MVVKGKGRATPLKPERLASEEYIVGKAPQRLSWETVAAGLYVTPDYAELVDFVHPYYYSTSKSRPVMCSCSLPLSSSACTVWFQPFFDREAHLLLQILLFMHPMARLMAFRNGMT